MSLFVKIQSHYYSIVPVFLRKLATNATKWPIQNENQSHRNGDDDYAKDSNEVTSFYDQC